jgi:hypothetical protein
MQVVIIAALADMWMQQITESTEKCPWPSLTTLVPYLFVPVFRDPGSKTLVPPWGEESIPGIESGTE